MSPCCEHENPNLCPNHGIRVGDLVFGRDGKEYLVKAIGGRDNTVIHGERPVHKRLRMDEVRLSRRGQP